MRRQRRLAKSESVDRQPRLLLSTASYERCAHYGWIRGTSTVKVQKTAFVQALAGCGLLRSRGAILDTTGNNLAHFMEPVRHHFPGIF